MKIERLTAADYRNLKNIDLVPSDGINVIFGENAQGKTNLLEGIYLFSGMRSFRGAKDSELIMFGSEKAKLSADFYSHERKQSAEIIIEKKRTAYLNGVQLNSTVGLSEQCHLIVFSPQHTAIVKDSPRSRRAFLNSGIGGVYPVYSEHLRKYTRALHQRNTLLKSIRKSGAYKEFLPDYDRALAEYGTRIVHARKRYIERLLEYLPQIYSDLSAKREKIEIEYLTSLESDSAENAIYEYEKSRNEDIAAGTTTLGPHRDDIEFLINGISAKDYGSQGQQKSVVLALKLSEAQLLKQVCGEQPVALLDDVMSELDEGRQDYILNHIKNWQVFITCCEKSAAERLNAGAAFFMKQGRPEKV